MGSHLWSIRAPNEVVDCGAMYDGIPNLFSLRIHHGGVFKDFPGRRYTKGEISYVDFVDKDLFSVLEFDDMIEELGLDTHVNLHYHFEIPGFDLEFGLHPFKTDQDVHLLTSFVKDHKLIDVYIEDGISVLDASSTGVSDEILNFNPFSDDPNISQTNENEVNDNEENDSSDSDFIVDEDNEIHDVEVDMRDFNVNVDSTVETMGCSSHIEEGGMNVEITSVDVIDNEEFDSGAETGDEMEERRRKKMKSLGKQSNVDRILKNNLYLGQVFPNSKVVKDMIKKHAVESMRELKIVKNDLMRMRVICEGSCPDLNNAKEHLSGPKVLNSGNEKQDKGKGKQYKGKGKDVNLKENKCPWVLYVSKLKDKESWQVKTLIDEHTCIQSRHLRICTSKFLSNKIHDLLESHPQIPTKALQDQLQNKFELGISKMKGFRAKAKATVSLKGDYMSQYASLRDYCEEVMKSNPGTTIKIEVEDPPSPDSSIRQFKRIYFCLGPLKQGFKAMKREFLGLDGCFMKGPFPGQILTAVGLDGNNGIYPLAYAVVKAECFLSWSWFLECLSDDLDLGINSNFTFMSDRQKGLLPAIAKLFPSAEHRYCLRHIHDNLKLRWKGRAYKDLLWKCATTLTVQQYDHAMSEMRQFNLETADWLCQIAPQHWTVIFYEWCFFVIAGH